VQSVSGRGNGLISSVVATLDEAFGVKIEVRDYSEHAMGAGSDARAAAYVECAGPDGKTIWGVGIDEDIATASVRAVLSAAIRIGGTTLRDYVGVDGVPGYFAIKLFVYERAGEPCRVCATRVRHLNQGQRSSYYCPHCQK